MITFMSNSSRDCIVTGVIKDLVPLESRYRIKLHDPCDLVLCLKKKQTIATFLFLQAKDKVDSSC